MSVEVPVLEVFDLADRLRAVAGDGFAASTRLAPPADCGALTAVLADFVEVFALAARALAVDIDQLAESVEAAARSWLALDAGILARRGQVLSR